MDKYYGLTEVREVIRDSKPPPEIYAKPKNHATNVWKGRDTQNLVHSVLDIVKSYGVHTTGESSVKIQEWCGRNTFEPHVSHWINQKSPIRFVLPSFPFKSGNLEKVTGRFPDMAEYLGLSRLHAMCLDIGRVYKFGAEITIASDGAVFNDICDIPNEHVWDYAEDLTNMVKAHSFAVKIVHIMSLLGRVVADEILTREVFLETIDECRNNIIDQQAKPEELSQKLAADPDSLRTYTQMSRFFEIDLAHSVLAGFSRSQGKKLTKKLARSCMSRSEAFTQLVLKTLPNHIRLSVHASSGSVKLSFPLIPQPTGLVIKVPWMCSIAITVDGKYRTGYANEFQDSYELVYMDGRPWCYMEKRGLAQLTGVDNFKISRFFP